MIEIDPLSQEAKIALLMIKNLCNKHLVTKTDYGPHHTHLQNDHFFSNNRSLKESKHLIQKHFCKAIHYYDRQVHLQ